MAAQSPRRHLELTLVGDQRATLAARVAVLNNRRDVIQQLLHSIHTSTPYSKLRLGALQRQILDVTDHIETIAQSTGRAHHNPQAQTG